MKGGFSMNNDQKKLSDAAAIAQFKPALIAPVIHGLYPDASRNAYYQRITEKPLTLPDGSVFQYSPKTISKWVSLYQNGGIEALMPQERSDKGSSRALPDTAIEARVDLKPVQTVKKGEHFSMKSVKIRPSDKLYKLVTVEELKKFKGLDVEKQRG